MIVAAEQPGSRPQPPRGLSLSLHGVYRRFFPRGREPFVAVRDVSLQVEGGSFTSVIGPSGCGKSTLLAIIAGLHPPSAGDVLIDGKANAKVRPDVGIMFQRDALLPWRTVLDNVALPLRYRGVATRDARARAEEWLRRVHLQGMGDRFPHQLSGGMRKRVSLAQTLVYEPSILLMDEPFSALDIQTRHLMENELLELWGERKPTVLFITHDLDEAISLSDRVALMTASPGRVREIVDIPLARPRDVSRVRFEPAFRRVYDQLWQHLRAEVGEREGSR